MRFDFDPDRDAVLQVDDCWLVAARLLAGRADPSSTIAYPAAYAMAVDRLAQIGYGCVPDPAAGDRVPDDLVATCIVYPVDPRVHARAGARDRERHLRMVCAMARTDGTFVGSELAVALDLATRLAGDDGERLRFRSIVHELFINPAAADDPLSQIAAMPRTQALQVVETLKTIAWADGLLRESERRMLEHVHVLLDLPVELVGALSCRTRFVEQPAA